MPKTSLLTALSTRFVPVIIAGSLVLPAGAADDTGPSAARAMATSLAFSPDGHHLATALGRSVKVWDLSSARDILSLDGHFGPVAAVAYSHDGKQVFTGSWDTTAAVWDGASGLRLKVFRGHTAAVTAVAISRDGSRVATASSDNTAKLWDTATGQLVSTLAAHAGPVYGLAFSRDGNRLATASWDQSVRLWDVASGRELRSFSAQPARAYGIAFSPDGSRLAAGGSDGTARLWEVESGSLIHMLAGHTGTVQAVAFSPDGAALATAAADGKVGIWDTASGKKLRNISGHEAAILGVEFDTEGLRIGTVSADGTARLWEVRSGRELRRLTARANGGQSSPAPSVAKQPGTSEPSPGYRIGAGDVLRVNVWKEPEASTPQVAVRADGKISLPILREVDAVGLTPVELEKKLTGLYNKFINQPEVSVAAIEINSEKVYLIGGVKKEGPVRLLYPMTVMQVLAEAGGLTDYAKKKDIYVLRTVNQKQVKLMFNYEAVLKGENMEQNIGVLPGDMIVVPQ